MAPSYLPLQTTTHHSNLLFFFSPSYTYTAPTMAVSLAVPVSPSFPVKFLSRPPSSRLPPRRLRLSASSSSSSSSFSTSDSDWMRITDAEFFRSDSRPIMLFDGVCNLCNGGVRIVRSIDPNRRIRYESLQSESGRKLLQRSGRAPDDISSVVLVEKNRSYIKSEAVLRIMEHLNLPFPQLAFMIKLIPLFVRDFAYDNVANNRYEIFGRTETESCDIS